MRILVDIRHLTQPFPTGIGRYTASLLEALFRLDKKNEYVLLSAGRGEAKKNVEKIFSETNLRQFPPNVIQRHLNVSNRFLNTSIFFRHQPALENLVREPCDLIWLPNFSLAAMRPTTPYVLTVHDLSWHLFPHLFSRKMRVWHQAVRPFELIKTAKKIIVPSNSTKNDLLRLVPESREKINVIYHGVSAQYSPKMAAGDHGIRSRHKLPKKFVLFIGTLEPRKNILTLIDGIEQYRQEYRDDIHLVLAGHMGWKSRTIQKRLHDRGLQSWVHYLGYVSFSDRPALYRACQAFFWPSLYEGFGLPVIEAMACGAPVISSAVAALPEVSGAAGIHIDPYNSRDITSVLRELMTSPRLQERLKHEGVVRAATFTWEESAKKTLKTFEEAI